jgi:hypothetical protein
VQHFVYEVSLVHFREFSLRPNNHPLPILRPAERLRGAVFSFDAPDLVNDPPTKKL